MSRFSGLPEPSSRISAIRDVTAAGNGAAGTRRFDDLLARGASLGSSTRLAAHRAEKTGEPVISRTISTQTQSPSVKPAAKAVVAAKSTPTVAAAPPKPVPPAIPADVRVQGPKAVAAYTSGYLRAKARGEELSKHPAVAGRSAEAMKMFREGKTNAEIIAALTADRRASASDEIWARARASIDGSGAAPAAPTIAAEPATPDHKPSAAEAKADAVWAKARASIDGHRAIAR